MFIAVTVILALVLALTFFTLRSLLVEESTNPNHRTLADRAYESDYRWSDLIRMRVEAATCLTLPCRRDALMVLVSLRPSVTCKCYGSMISTLDSWKESVAFKGSYPIIE